jgi:nucleotide-binding universal stress UspA family protein
MNESSMMKILVAIDGSASALRALHYVLRLMSLGLTVEIHLLNVQAAAGSPHAKMFFGSEDIKRYCHEEGTKALAEARQVLDAAGVAYTHHIVMGRTAESITRFAKQHAIDQIVMGSRGTSALSDFVLGSVAQEVIEQVDIPVTLLR